jgi:hypothetical protein
MDPRDETVARNEAMFRAVNREIEQASEEAGRDDDDRLEVLCECGQDGCGTTLTLTIGEFEGVHGQKDRFVVAAGHENPDIERVVARKEQYLIVDKFGEAEEIVEGDAPSS